MTGHPRLRQTRMSAVLVLALLMVVPFHAADAAQAVTCGGLTATITGTTGDDVLNGTTGNDVIRALGGDDTINGLAGNDIICGDAGDDIIRGDAGNDTLIGGGGDDELYGGSGKDKLRGKKGTDRLDGGSGADKLWGGEQGDTLSGGDGNDVVAGEGGDDSLVGGSSDDSINGGAGRDLLDFSGGTGPVVVDLSAGSAVGEGTDTVRQVEVVVGTDAADRIFGNGANNAFLGLGGNDLLDGRTGDDLLLGGDGNDTLNGRRGDDEIDPGPGNDNAIGGLGIYDILDMSFAAGPVNVNLASGAATGDGADTVAGFEFVVGSIFDDVLTGSQKRGEVLIGGFGDDILNAGAGDIDIVVGGDGDDRLVGGPGALDSAYFASAPGAVTVDLAAGIATGEGADTLTGIEALFGSPFDDKLLGDARQNLLYGLLGNDTINGRAGVDLVSYGLSARPVVANLGSAAVTGEGNDTLWSIEGVFGSPLGDTIVGDGAANLLFGEGGRDVIRGKGGDDILDGGSSFDELNGGSGYDYCDAGEVLIGCEDSLQNAPEPYRATATLTDSQHHGVVLTDLLASQAALIHESGQGSRREALRSLLPHLNQRSYTVGA